MLRIFYKVKYICFFTIFSCSHTTSSNDSNMFSNLYPVKWFSNDNDTKDDNDTKEQKLVNAPNVNILRSEDSIDKTVLSNLINDSIKRIPSHRIENSVLMLGGTGVGKSTTTNYLLLPNE